MTYPPRLQQIIEESCERLDHRLGLLHPYLARRAHQWLNTLTGGHRLSDSVQDPDSFPMVLLVSWLEESLAGAADREFQIVMAYSCITAYLFIRIHDNVMDGDVLADPRLLPLAGVLHQEFQSSLAAVFPSDSEFWGVFRATWDESAFVTVYDADAKDLTEEDFLQVSGRKCSAVAIQLAAVCFRFHRREALEPWRAFLDALSVWHQFDRDLWDWNGDQAKGTTTFFLSEARRRKKPGETVDGWVYREGFSWGRVYLGRLTARLRGLALPLQSRSVGEYIDERERSQQDRFDRVERGLSAARLLFEAVDS